MDTIKVFWRHRIKSRANQNLSGLTSKSNWMYFFCFYEIRFVSFLFNVRIEFNWHKIDEFHHEDFLICLVVINIDEGMNFDGGVLLLGDGDRSNLVFLFLGLYFVFVDISLVC